jgi:hypothetical protein
VPTTGLGAWAAVVAIPDPTQAGAEVAPVVAPVTTAERRASGVVTVEVQQAAAATVQSTVGGIVTATVPVGTVLGNGTEAVRIDDRPVPAMVAAAPLWRSLTRGDRGEDVRRLQEFLVATGHLTIAPDGVFGSSTATAVADFARTIGLPRGTTTFDPAWVVWVGAEPFEVRSVTAPVGTAVGAGTPLLGGPQAAQAVTVAEPQGGLGAAFGEVAELVVGSVRVPYPVGSGVVTEPADVAALVGALSPTTSGSGRVEATDGVEVLSVPASAVVSGPSGAVCVYPGAEAAPVRVTTVGGGASTVQIDPASVAEDLTSVLVNPGAVDGLAPCG